MNKIKYILLFLFCFTLTAYSQTEKEEINDLWNYMVFKKGGCLGGEQYFRKDKKETPTMIFSEKEWKTFSKKNIVKLTEFLIKKLSDTTITNIHTCPFFNATNGEMALYALQHLYKKNWYDFPEFKEYKDKKITHSLDQPQIWIQRILKDKNKRNKLIEYYLNENKQK